MTSFERMQALGLLGPRTACAHCVWTEPGDREILRALRDSGGTAIGVADEDSMRWLRRLGGDEGIYGSPEDGAVIAAIPALLERGDLGRGERVVGFLTGSGYKYRSGMQAFVARHNG